MKNSYIALLVLIILSSDAQSQHSVTVQRWFTSLDGHKSTTYELGPEYGAASLNLPKTGNPYLEFHRDEKYLEIDLESLDLPREIDNHTGEITFYGKNRETIYILFECGEKYEGSVIFRLEDSEIKFITTYNCVGT